MKIFNQQFIEKMHILIPSLIICISGIALLYFHLSIFKTVIPILLIIVSLIKIVKRKLIAVRKEGLIKYMPNSFQQGLMQRSIFDILCDLWYLPQIIKYIKILFMPFIYQIEPEKVYQIFNEFDENFKRLIWTKGVANVFPTNIRNILLPQSQNKSVVIIQSQNHFKKQFQSFQQHNSIKKKANPNKQLPLQLQEVKTGLLENSNIELLFKRNNSFSYKRKNSKKAKDKFKFNGILSTSDNSLNSNNKQQVIQKRKPQIFNFQFDYKKNIDAKIFNSQIQKLSSQPQTPIKSSDIKVFNNQIQSQFDFDQKSIISVPDLNNNLQQKQPQIIQNIPKWDKLNEYKMQMQNKQHQKNRFEHLVPKHEILQYIFSLIKLKKVFLDQLAQFQTPSIVLVLSFFIGKFFPTKKLCKLSLDKLLLRIQNKLGRKIFLNLFYYFINVMLSYICYELLKNFQKYLVKRFQLQQKRKELVDKFFKNLGLDKNQLFRKKKIEINNK